MRRAAPMIITHYSLPMMHHLPARMSGVPSQLPCGGMAAVLSPSRLASSTRALLPLQPFSQHRGFPACALSWPATLHPACLAHSASLCGSTAARVRDVSTAAVRRRRTADSISLPGTTMSLDDAQCVPEYAQEYWEEVLARIDGLPHLNEMRAAMDPRLPIGMTMEWARTKTSKPLPLFNEFIRYKMKYPTHVILIQIGDFYETIGIDALVMAKWLGNRIMNEKDGVPKAGVPINQRYTTVDRLVAEGFEVVVISQREGSPGAGSTGRMDREVDGIHSASHSTCRLRGLGDDSAALNNNQLFVQQRPIMGIANTKMGYVLHTLVIDIRKVVVSANLTESAVMSQLTARNPTTLLFHSSISEPKRRMVKAMVARHTRNQIIKSQIYDEPDITAGFLNKITDDLYATDQGLNSGASSDEASAPEFEVVYDNAEADGRPQPPPKSTIMQLGMEGDRSIPNLLDFLLPHSAPLATKVWMSELVMLPPPPDQALHVHAILDFMANFTQALPSLDTSLPAGKVVEVIESGSGDGGFFRQLHALLQPLINDLSRPEFDQLWEHMLPYALWMNRSSDAMSVQQLRQNLTKVVHMIEHVVQMDTSDDVFKDVGYERDRPARARTLMRASMKKMDLEARLLSDTSTDEPAKMFQECEKFRRHVRSNLLEQELQLVAVKRDKVEELLWATLLEFIGMAKAGELKQVDDTVVIQLRVKPRVTAEELMTSYLAKLTPPINLLSVDVAASKNMRQYSSRQIREATAEYHVACRAAEKQARVLLRELCQDLHELLPSLLLACRVCVIKTALEQHTLASRQRQWVSPQLSPVPTPQSRDDQSHGFQPTSHAATPSEQPSTQVMKLTDYWPYWLSVTDRYGTVTNTLELDRFVLLTGPNMAGKSTSLRSVCAVALLANCGLNVPAAAAVVPWYDAFLLRNFSGDAPMEGKSSFALEMEEVVAAGLTCTHRSLILMDELGKGTEVEKGTSLVYSVIEQWCRRSFTGICATHLLMMASIARKHGLERDGLLHFKQVGFGANAKKLLDGVCYDSQAEVIASQAGLPSHILDRAKQIQREVAAGEHHMNMESFNWLGEQVLVQGGAPDVRAISPGPPPNMTQSQLQVTVQLIHDSNAAQDEDSSSSSSPEAREVTHEAASTPQLTLQDAAEVLREVLRSDMDQGSLQELELVHVPRGYEPAPFYAYTEVVYVFRGPRGKFYCGRTTDIVQRIREHRHSKARDKGKEIDLVYAPVTVGSSEQLESWVIQALVHKGFPMMSTRGKNKTRVVVPRKQRAAAAKVGA